MSDPVRLRESEETPEELREMLESGMQPSPLTAADRAQILAAATRIAAGTGAAVGVASSSTKTSALLSGWFGKTVGTAAVLLSVGIAAEKFQRSNNPPPQQHSQPAQTTVSAPRTSSVPAVIAPPAAPVLVAPREAPPPAVAEPVAPVVTPRVAPPMLRNARVRAVAATAPTNAVVSQAPPVVPRACPLELAGGGLAEESRVLVYAHGMLATNPAISAACAELLERNGVSSTLREEHRYVRFSAARRMGRVQEARRYAQLLQSEAPNSVYVQQTQQWLAEHPEE